MKAPLLLLGLAISLSLLLVVTGSGLRPPADASPDTAAAASPAAAPSATHSAAEESAEGQLVLQRCGGCHGLQTLSHNPLTAAGWDHEIDLMQQLGAQVSASERPGMVAYLARHFGKTN